MSWWKQALLAIVVLLLTGLGWARVDPAFDARMRGFGVPAPIVLFLATTAGVDAGDKVAGDAPGTGGPGRGRDGATLVVTAEVETAVINNRVTAIGDGEAVRSVIAVPLSAGILTDVRVAAGHRVVAGEILALLDAEAEEIARDRAALAVEIAADTMVRYDRLRDARTLTEVQRRDAQNALQNARLALREAENELRRRSITAQIDGVVGIVPVETGDFVKTDTTITTIDDRSRIVVDFWVPERFAAIIAVGQEVKVDPIALPGEVFSGEVTAIGSRIDRDSRTLQIRAEVANPDDRLRPGMSFQVSMRFPGQAFAAINPLALQWSSDGAFVWKIEDDKAQRVGVRIVQRNSDQVLIEGPLAAGDIVVIEGVQSVRQGGEVRAAETDLSGGS